MKIYRCKYLGFSPDHSITDPRIRVIMHEDHHDLGGRTGEVTITSRVKEINFEVGYALTQNSVYLFKTETSCPNWPDCPCAIIAALEVGVGVFNA